MIQDSHFLCFLVIYTVLDSLGVVGPPSPTGGTAVSTMVPAGGGEGQVAKFMSCELLSNQAASD